MKYWEIIIENLRTLDGIAAVSQVQDHKGRQFWVVAAEREDAGRFIVRSDELLTAFLELESTVRGEVA